MADTRLLKDQVATIDMHLYKAIHAQDGDMAMFYVEKAEKVLAELRRELWLSSHRSGEVR